MKLQAAAVVFLFVSLGRAQQAEASAGTSKYQLGPDDQVTIWALGLDEFADKSFRVDPSGSLDLPLVGRIQAAGSTAQDLQARLSVALREYLVNPEVSVRISEFKSQPVSVIGAVKTPGVHQLQGRKSLIEVLSLAGGPSEDAGNEVKITRKIENGRIPIQGAADDATGQFSVAQLSLRSILQAKNPQQNIAILPHDVISVPPADLIYVMGEVEKPGGFVLHEREAMSVLQALSMAGGVTRIAATADAKILRAASGTKERTELPVDLRKILSGKAMDVALQPNDVLFVPHNNGKAAALKAAETAIGLGTGVIIWRR